MSLACTCLLIAVQQSACTRGQANSAFPAIRTDTEHVISGVGLIRLAALHPAILHAFYNPCGIPLIYTSRMLIRTGLRHSLLAFDRSFAPPILQTCSPKACLQLQPLPMWRHLGHGLVLPRKLLDQACCPCRLQGCRIGPCQVRLQMPIPGVCS